MDRILSKSHRQHGRLRAQGYRLTHLLNGSTIVLLSKVCQQWVCLKADRTPEDALALQLQLSDVVHVMG